MRPLHFLTPSASAPQLNSQTPPPLSALGDVFFVLGAIIIASSYHLVQITLGRVILGFGVGVAAAVTPMCESTLVLPSRGAPLVRADLHLRPQTSPSSPPPVYVDHLLPFKVS